MSNKKFGDLLLDWLKQSDVSRKNLIALLQNDFYRDFKGLDSITLSRWVNGKSTPALYKQLLIAKVLGKDPIKLLMNLNHRENSPKKISAILEKLTRSLDLSLNVLSYENIPEKITSEIVIHSSVEHSKQFDAFYSNVSALSQFRLELLSIDKCKHYTILLKNEHGKVIGHWSSILDIKWEHFSSLPTASKMDIKRACLVQLGHFTNSEQFFELVVQASCFYLKKLWVTKEIVYIFVAGRSVVDFCVLVLGAEIAQYYRPIKKSDKLNVYLIKFDIVRAITNPIILPKIKSKLDCLQGCNNCELCNLKDIS